MVKQEKIDEVKDLTVRISEKKNIILTRYSGVKVKSLSNIRNTVREKNADYFVVKNNRFKRALKDSGYESMVEHIKGPIAVAFANDEIADVAKVLKDFSKEEENFSFYYGVIDNVVYGEKDLMRVADLPSKEVLLSQVLSMVNGPATGVAMGMNQIMSSLARGIQAVAEAQNK